jgi:argininosuccinate lyase
MSFRQVHHVVARLVRNCVTRDIGRASATAALLDEAALETVGKAVGMTDAAVKEALDPQRFVETRVTRGSVAPAEVDRMLESTRVQNQADADWLRAERERIAGSARQLAAAVGAIVA